MITSRRELKEYLIADKNALRKNYNRPRYSDVIWKYEICLRYAEYHFNVKNLRGGTLILS